MQQVSQCRALVLNNESLHADEEGSPDNGTNIWC